MAMPTHVDRRLPHAWSECEDPSCVFYPQLISCYEYQTVGRRRDPSPEEIHKLFHEECSSCKTSKHGGNLCAYCRHLRLDHLLVCIAGQGSRIYYEIRTGTVKELHHRSQHCDYCHFLLRSVELKGMAWHGAWRAEDHGDEEIVFAVSGGGPEFVVSVGEFSIYVSCNPTADKENTSSRELREFVSFPRLKEWLARCEEQHHPADIPGGEVEQPEGMLVIDVRKACVIPAPECCKYAALSYVWGPPKPGQVEATKRSIDSLRQPGSLTGDEMPATIRDAMALCCELDIQFLWVDRVCIIQDDESFKMKQINAMDAIYSRAVVSLCAAAGNDSDAGLFGTKSTPRTLCQRKFTIAGLDLMAGLPSPRMFRSETWWTRGWTYQEYMLSKRIILFSPWQVVFECDHGAFHEGMTSEAQPDWNRADKLAPLPSYQRTVGEYNQRTLSYASDIYNAFVGVFKSQYKNLDDYTFGLPALDFDASLLWRRGPGTKRVASDDRGVFPTWSWASATGWVRFHSRCHGTLATWYHVPQYGSNPAPIHASGSDGAHPDWHTEKPVGCQPRLAVAVAWLLGLIDGPVPTVISKSRTISVLDQATKSLWPRYQALWESLQQPHPLLPEDSHLKLRGKSGRIAARTTVGNLKLRNVKNSLTGKHFEIEGEDGCMIGNGSTDTHDDLDGRNFLFVALSVNSDGSNITRIVFDNDSVLGRPASDHPLEEDGRESPSDKYGRAELERQQKLWKAMTPSVMKASPILYTPPLKPPPQGGEDMSDSHKKRSISPDVTYHDSKGTPLSPPPALNVMMIELNDGVAHRLGLGEVLMIQWAKQNVRWETIVLE